MQSDTLISGSIADNICLYDDDPDYTWMRECAYIARIADDIEDMSMGYETLIGDMGSALSGGQKQRIILARALYAKPKILFLDEATSHLDIILEKHLNDALDELKITRISVSHRPETIKYADRIFDLSKGLFFE
jgi:ATP-binding cassette subfamily B protein RaxB